MGVVFAWCSGRGTGCKQEGARSEGAGVGLKGKMKWLCELRGVGKNGNGDVGDGRWWRRDRFGPQTGGGRAWNFRT